MCTLFGAAVLAVMACGCDGSKIPSQRTVFDLARKAAEENALIPAGAEVLPIDKSIFSIGKNAARVDLAYRAGDGRIAHHSICLKRVARTWTFERAYPAPVYD
jgi:hypothetical protein